MDKDIFLKAEKIFREIEKGENKINELNGLLSHDGKMSIIIKSNVNQICADDKRATQIYLKEGSEEFEAVIDLLETLRKEKVDDLKYEFENLSGV